MIRLLRGFEKLNAFQKLFESLYIDVITHFQDNLLMVLIHRVNCQEIKLLTTYRLYQD